MRPSIFNNNKSVFKDLEFDLIIIIKEKMTRISI